MGEKSHSRFTSSLMIARPFPLPRHWATWLATAVLLLSFALSLTSIRDKSPTFDEQGFLTRGVGYARGDNRHMRVGHPAGLNVLNAMFLASDDQVRLPVDDPSWQTTAFHRPSELFMWEIGNDVRRVLFLGRLPTIFLGLLLLAVAGRWAWEMSGRRWVGLLALALLAFDPNILAHMRLATTDLGLTAAALLAGYLLWRFWQRPSWGRAILAGAAFGLLQNSKFTAGLFVPIFALIILIQWGMRIAEYGVWNWRATWRALLMLTVAYALVAPLTLWACYGLQIGALPENLPTLSQLSGLTLPLAHHLEQLLDIGGRMQKGTPAFLRGSYSDSGWWYYFPVAFALKTPLPTLLLLATAVVVYLRFRIDDLRLKSSILNRQSSIFLLLPALGYFAFALTTDINLGYRHILPTLPFWVVFTAVTLSQLSVIGNRLSVAILSGSLVWLIVISLWIHPHYLAFFNVFAGGPDGGWRYLVDSNLDWGQDLPGLKQWMDENDVDHVWLSYFGEGRPNYYGIRYTGLDSWPPRLMNPEARPFYPHDPAPGIYAISATTLQGVHFANHDQFAWFREREPLAKIGYSIFIYEVAARGVPTDLVMSGVQLDEIAPADFALLGTNNVTPHWFDAAQSWLMPAAAQGWLALGRGTAVHPTWQPLLAEWDMAAQTATYTLYRLPALAQTAAPLAQFTNENNRITLLDGAVEATAAPGGALTLTTRWLQQGAPQPVKIFIHVMNGDEQIVAQWDGLDAAWAGWRSGDTLWQAHTLILPADTPPGVYAVWAGLYHPDSDVRWQTAVADRFLLGSITVADQ